MAEVVGQAEIPGATSLVTPSTGRRGPHASAPPAAYLALSAQVTSTGLWRVHLMHRSSFEQHVRVTRLDGGEGGTETLMWLADLLQEYVGDVKTVLRP